MIDVSVVVPLYNEQESVPRMHGAITKALAETSLTYEIIFIDDGSKDDTFRIAENLAKTDSSLRVIKFRRNYGQTPAMAAGIDNAAADIIVTMDGDLQNDPRDIPMLIDKINDGFDIVVGWRFNRQDKLWSRKIPSKIANWLIGKVTGVPIKDNGCSLKAFKADVIKRVPLYNEMHRFIPAMASIAGPRLAEVQVRHHAREFGESKYGLSRVYKVLLDLITIKMIASFAARPLVWFTLLAIPFLLASMVLATTSLVPVFLGRDMAIPIAGTGIIFFTLAVFLIIGGAIAELIQRTGSFNATDFPLMSSTLDEYTSITDSASVDREK